MRTGSSSEKNTNPPCSSQSLKPGADSRKPYLLKRLFTASQFTVFHHAAR